MRGKAHWSSGVSMDNPLSGVVFHHHLLTPHGTTPIMRLSEKNICSIDREVNDPE